MATGPITNLADVIVPEVFTPYAQLLTEEKSRLIQSGAMSRDPLLDTELAGGGLTFHVPSFKDLDNDEDNVSSDDADDSFTGGTTNSAPKKTGTVEEIAVRLNRNQSWSSSDLAADLIGADPMNSIASRVADYWQRRLQRAFISTVKGVFADNDAAPTGTEHTQGDLTNDIKGTAVGAATKFSAPAFIDALATMGDSDDDLGMVMVHSVVYNQMRKNNLIEFIPASDGKIMIPTFLGRTVIRDDSMPNAGGVFDTWIFGAGAVRFGRAAPATPTETSRKPDSGNGGGSSVLYNRVQWCLHPAGHKYVGAASKGGPSNTVLEAATSWQRAYTERKQIKIARLVTREM